MEEDIIMIAEILDSSDRIEGKLHIVDICHDILETVRTGSRKGEEDQNALIIQKIVKGIVDKIEDDEMESVSVEDFMKAMYKCLYKLDIVMSKKSLLRLRVIETGIALKIKNSPYIELIDEYEDLDMLEKCCLAIIYKEYQLYLANGACELLGEAKAAEILSEFMPRSLEGLTEALDDAMEDDEMTIKELVSDINSRFAKISKNVYLDKYKNGELDLRKSKLAPLCGDTSKRDSIPLFITDIYERTLFIDEEEADKEFTVDCCDLLNVTEEEYKKKYLLPGAKTHLQMARLLRMINNKKKDE